MCNHKCMYIGELWRATGCWTDKHTEHRAWSNIVCVNRGEVGAHRQMVELSATSM